MNALKQMVRRSSKHDVEMLDIDDVYVNGKAEYGNHDEGLTAAERRLDEGDVPHDLDGEGLSDYMNLAAPGNTQKPNSFRFLDLPREIRDHVWTPNSLFFIQNLKEYPESDLYRYMSTS